MRKHLRLRRPSSAMVVAMIALFIALGPAAYAAANTVFSTDIVDGEVKNPDIAVNAVGSGKVIDNSLKGIDVLESSLTKVPNADRLDGLDSTGFIQGKGNVYRDSFTVPDDDRSSYFMLPVPGFGNLTAHCEAGTAVHTFLNQSGGDLQAVWFNRDGTGAQTLANNGVISLTPVTGTPYVVILQVSRFGRTATITSSQKVAANNECSFAGQAVAQIDS
jgi:hypothetical protein